MQDTQYLDPSYLIAAVAAAPEADADALSAASARNAVLTKPAGALGRLETLARFCAGWRGRGDLAALDGQITLFAGNHGVAARGVSPYPSSVTSQMVANFEAGGAAINQIARRTGARLSVTPLSLDRPTADFTVAPALGPEAFKEALATGWNAVDPDADVLIPGEMGIGNTTAAAATAAALFGGAPSDWVGPGAGAEGETLATKRSVVADGVARHAESIAAAPENLRGLETLRRLGGREMAAIAGAVARARAERMIVLLDGYIVTAAAAALFASAPRAIETCLAGHRSAEPSHARLLDALRLEPILDLGLRLGEGSGAALAFGVLQAAAACHGGMATFESAGVDGPA